MKEEEVTYKRSGRFERRLNYRMRGSRRLRKKGDESRREKYRGESRNEKGKEILKLGGDL